MLQLPNSFVGRDLNKVKSYNEALLHITQPSSREVLFEEDDDVFYIVETDMSNNKVAVDRFRFYPEPLEDVNDKKYASKADFVMLKEMIENVQQSVRELSEANNNASAGSSEKLPVQYGNKRNKQNSSANRGNDANS